MVKTLSNSKYIVHRMTSQQSSNGVFIITNKTFDIIAIGYHPCHYTDTIIARQSWWKAYIWVNDGIAVWRLMCN